MLNTLIPWPLKLCMAALLAAALVGFGWFQGAAHVQEKWSDERAAQATKAAKIVVKQAHATVTAVTRYVDRVRVVERHGNALIKEVPVYVPSDSCDLPGGWRVLHDAAARGNDPSPGSADAPPVGAQDAAATVIENYSACRANAEQLIALQALIKDKEQINGNAD